MNPLQQTTKKQPGNVAGWILTFHEATPEGNVKQGDPALTLSSDDYYAGISASLPEGLQGGSYQFVIEGMTDGHYRQLAERADDGTRKIRAVRLFLFWVDTNSSVLGYLANVAGLSSFMPKPPLTTESEAFVAELAITKLSRRTGERKYEAVIDAREWVFDKLANRRVCPPDIEAHAGLQPLPMILQLTNDVVPRLEFERPEMTVETENESTGGGGLEVGQTLVETLQRLGNMLAQRVNKHGRGMFLIRNGMLWIGMRPVPLFHDTIPLTLSTGLIEIEPTGEDVIDPNRDVCAAPPAPSPVRRKFKLTLKGHAEIKPGDVLEFDLPPEEVTTTSPGPLGMVADFFSAPLLDALNDEPKNPIKFYVATVDHRLSRTSGFVTTVNGVQITALNDDAWDTHTQTHRDSESGGTSSDSGSSASRAANALTRQISAALDQRRLSEVGEVRAVTVTGTGASAEPPAQTLGVWRGLAPGAGAVNGARRQDVQRPSPAPASGVPYLTPFAWGKTGLILPYYAGMRVLVDHRNGNRSDPVVLGSFWASGESRESEAGDYWLSLPVGVPESQRVSITGDEPPQAHEGEVTNDLIDADGNRVIEVGQFTLRVGQSALKDAGKRPQNAEDAHSITIENKDGNAVIILKSDGTIILRGTKIELDAGSGNINMSANNVNISVNTAVNIS